MKANRSTLKALLALALLPALLYPLAALTITGVSGSLVIRREVPGEKHPTKATSLIKLGGLLDSMGDYAGARPYYEQALAILKASLPKDHPYIQIVSGNLELLNHIEG